MFVCVSVVVWVCVCLYVFIYERIMCVCAYVFSVCSVFECLHYVSMGAGMCVCARACDCVLVCVFTCEFF